MRPWSLSLLVASWAVLAASHAFAQAPPPMPGTAAPDGAAWACTRATLLDDAPCTVEGRTTAQAPSREQARENQRQARVLADEVCNAVAVTAGGEPDATLLQLCASRAGAAVKRCGGDGSRRLLDDNGRFNPGHARCYAALSTLAREVRALAEASSSCCECAAASCGASAGQCVDRLGQGRAPDVSSQCLEGACASACAEVRLIQRAASSASSVPPASRKP